MSETKRGRHSCFVMYYYRCGSGLKISYFPKLCTDLIATLSTLNVQNFSHCAVESGRRITRSDKCTAAPSGKLFGFVQLAKDCPCKPTLELKVAL